MKNYFTISEFAKLRDININSLRYYEKLGLLKPAFIDENNGYRYYSAEQVSLLNKIILCIQLGIPLKEMVEFLDEDGNLQSQKLLEKGRILAKKRIQEMQNNLDYIDYSLKNIEESKAFVNQTGVYKRHFDERKVMLTAYYEGELDAKKMISEVSKLYKYAQKKGMFPILPAGLVVNYESDGTMHHCFFMEVLNVQGKEEKILTIPAGEYSCVKIELEESFQFTKVIDKYWPEYEKKTFILNNVMLEKYSFESRPSELQRLDFSL